MKNYSLAIETLGYVTSQDQTNSDIRLLVAGSQNVVIDQQRKVRIAGGYTRFGAANTALTPIRNGKTWNSSTGLELPMRIYDDELEVYLGTVDGTAINAWTRVKNSFSTTEVMRFATWWDTSETLDLLLMVIGDTSIYEWGGGVAIASTTTVNTITKAGTATFAQNRYYANRDRTLINLRTGTEFTYTGGAGTTTLTGVAPDPTADIIAGDILVQKVVTSSVSGGGITGNLDTIGQHENQLAVGSDDANEVFLSKNTDYNDFSFSTPRVAGEGLTLVADGPSKGFGSLGKTFVAFAGTSSIFTIDFEEILVGSALAETAKTKRLDAGINQSAFSADCIAQVADSIIYLTQEPALRVMENPQNVSGLQPKTLSNPIKPDFDAETFTNAHIIWSKNAIYLSSPINSRLYILEFVEDANGQLNRFWDAPQILPVRALVLIGGLLHGHSNAVPETYKLFDGFSGVNSEDEKLPIQAIAKFAYNNYGKRANLKNFDEYFIEGEITTQTNDLQLTLNYDFGGSGQQITETIDGTDETILLGNVPNASLAQVPLAQNPLAGSLQVPDDTRKFRVIFEEAKEDFFEIQPVFETNETDRYWAIISHGTNAKLSRRRAIDIMK